MKRAYQTSALAVFFVLAGLFFSYGSPYIVADPVAAPREAARTVQAGGQIVRIVVAQTPEEHQKGLSGRESLAQDEGMLFVFPEDGKYAFWMKDMRFSIDILWLSEDGKIVYMVQNASPDTYPANFAPTLPARYVLELPAGFVSRNAVAIGDIVRL